MAKAVVKLWYGPMPPNFPAGFAATYNSLEDAMAQAVADLRSDREGKPVRVETEDGSKVLADRAAIEKAAG